MPHSHITALALHPRTGLIPRLRDAWTEAAARRRDRRHLAQLDVHLLRDIGLSPDEVQSEASKPFWRP
jgi:uncharacterized protein YjiS (DUF1127 family)